MGSKISISVVLFLLMNILLSTAVTAFYDPPTLPTPTHTPPKAHSCPPPPQQSPPPPPKKQSNSPPPPPPKPKSSSFPTPTPQSPTTPTYSSKGKCPRNAIKLGVCANLLGGLVSVFVGSDHNTPCCTLIKGLTDLEAAVCLCTAIKAHVLHTISLDIEVSLNLILNSCGKRVPSGFKCSY